MKDFPSLRTSGPILEKPRRKQKKFVQCRDEWEPNQSIKKQNTLNDAHIAGDQRYIYSREKNLNMFFFLYFSMIARKRKGGQVEGKDSIHFYVLKTEKNKNKIKIKSKKKRNRKNWL